MNHRRWLILVCLALALFTCACALGEVLQQPAGLTPNSSTSSPPPASATPTAAGQPEISLAPGTLPSYRSRLQLTFIGQDAQGKTTSARVETLVEVDASAHATHRLVFSETRGQRPGSLDLYQTEKGQFLVSSENSAGAEGCLRTAEQTPESFSQRAFTPQDLISAVSLGELIAKGGTVNQTQGDHYRLSAVRLSFGTVATTGGEIWIDPQSGRVLASNGWAEGALGLDGGGSYKRVEWQYTLETAVPVQISLPPDCQILAANDLPLPAAAGDLRQAGSSLSFDVQAKAPEVVDFYRSRLLKDGWTITTDSGGGASFLLKASRANRSLQIDITALETYTHVVILQNAP